MKVELTDLTEITRNSKIAKTTVYIRDKYDERIPWLVLGEVEIRNEGRICWLSAYLTAGVSDFEHDSAHAVRLPLVGLKFDHVWYHTTYLTAWIDPNDPDSFHVPKPGYNPMKHPEACMCDADYCEPHMMVPPGYYVPPHDAELYEAVKGKKIEISIGFHREE